MALVRVPNPDPLDPPGGRVLGFQEPENIPKQFQAAWLNQLAWSTLKGNILPVPMRKYIMLQIF